MAHIVGLFLCLLLNIELVHWILKSCSFISFKIVPTFPELFIYVYPDVLGCFILNSAFYNSYFFKNRLKNPEIHVFQKINWVVKNRIHYCLNLLTFQTIFSFKQKHSFVNGGLNSSNKPPYRQGVHTLVTPPPPPLSAAGCQG